MNLQFATSKVLFATTLYNIHNATFDIAGKCSKTYKVQNTNINIYCKMVSAIFQFNLLMLLDIQIPNSRDRSQLCNCQLYYWVVFVYMWEEYGGNWMPLKLILQTHNFQRYRACSNLSFIIFIKIEYCFIIFHTLTRLLFCTVFVLVLQIKYSLI